MGWFGKDILDGDIPLDTLDNITKWLELEGINLADLGSYSPRIRRFIKGSIEAFTVTRLIRNSDKLWTRREDLQSPKEPWTAYEDDRNIGVQVVALVAVEAGAWIGPESYNRIGGACAADMWSRDDPERKEFVDELWARVVSHAISQKKPNGSAKTTSRPDPAVRTVERSDQQSLHRNGTRSTSKRVRGAKEKTT